MSYSTFQLVLLASTVEDFQNELQLLIQESSVSLVQVVNQLLLGEVTPQAAFQFEEALQVAGRDLMRVITQWTYNQLEGDDPQAMPPIVRYEGGEYRRVHAKTPNREVSTRFGKITLWRFPYRYRQRESESGIFPLELLLGLTHGATPALADSVARYMADTGASQGRVLERLRRDHDVRWGVERLRKLTAALAESRDAFRHPFQVARVLALLREAYDSRGKYKPVLAVGRDGISVCQQPHGFWEVAAVATITVYDRSGKRLATIYLAQMPELGQGTLSQQLKRLIRDVLHTWDRPMPRLCYVTDAGENETKFYCQVLRNLRDPRCPRRRLSWYRIVDYYHTAERITTMAECLFGKNSAKGTAWARRMRKSLLKTSGASRVLHSAGALAKKKKMGRKRKKEFDKACNYLRRRTRFMDYHAYRQMHLPIGSGVTEAACKTVFTQRLKLSGMRWKDKGGQAVLNLRVLLLSGIWNEVRDASLASQKPRITLTHCKHDKSTPKIAA